MYCFYCVFNICVFWPVCNIFISCEIKCNILFLLNFVFLYIIALTESIDLFYFYYVKNG